MPTNLNIKEKMTWNKKSPGYNSKTRFSNDSSQKADKPDLHERSSSFANIETRQNVTCYFQFPAEHIVRFMLTCLAYPILYTCILSFSLCWTLEFHLQNNFRYLRLVSIIKGCRLAIGKRALKYHILFKCLTTLIQKF